MYNNLRKAIIRRRQEIGFVEMRKQLKELSELFGEQNTSLHSGQSVNVKTDGITSKSPLICTVVGKAFMSEDGVLCRWIVIPGERLPVALPEHNCV